MGRNSHRPKEPPVPYERHDTVRHEITAALHEQPLTAREISGLVRISEKEVAGHLEHIRLTLDAHGEHLDIIPAECQNCGFVFSKRERMKKPGRCPVCKGEKISPPAFRITGISRPE